MFIHENQTKLKLKSCQYLFRQFKQ